MQGWDGTLSFSGWAGAATGSRDPEPWPQDEDTLLGRGLDVLSWGRGAGHLLGVGKLGQQPQAEVFSPLVLLPPVDEDLVLQVRRARERIKYEEWRGNWGAWSQGSRCPPQTKCNTSPCPHWAPAMCPTVTVISKRAHSLFGELSHRHENASCSVSQSMAQGWQLVCKQPTLIHKEIRSLHPNGNPGCYRACCLV